MVRRGAAWRRVGDPRRRGGERPGQRGDPLRRESPDRDREQRHRRALGAARRLRGRQGRARGHGRDDAAAQPPRRGVDARRRGRASRRRGDPARSHGGGRAGQRQETARRLVRGLGRELRRALPEACAQVPRRPEASLRLTIALPARAKLNLDLEVIKRRDDGYHDLRSTMQTIDLHDLLLIAKADATELTVSGLTLGNNDNSVLQAHQALERATRRNLPASFHLHKRIPPGSGMGGASSDAAAALRGLQALFGLEIDIAHVAQDIGSDVPFFLHGGRALVEGRGERVQPLPAPEPMWFAIAWPGIELSTRDVYAAWDQVKGEAPNHLRAAAERVEPRLLEFAKRLGGGWQLTGSGSAFFKAVQTEQEAREAVKGLDGWTAVSRAAG
ncbi:MAG: 4-(cytidine 5'-diphospho)-2-C-methyl-D-erythritol kinase [Chloroflexi bacterium]|nr:MAG: 4-(cytidine 5'-diphospho)-2-C-methyl-D-erythritol kinase [Chloroflexota bacterium]